MNCLVQNSDRELSDPLRISLDVERLGLSENIRLNKHRQKGPVKSEKVILL